jgi:hypothetical protein
MVKSETQRATEKKRVDGVAQMEECLTTKAKGSEFKAQYQEEPKA